MTAFFIWTLCGVRAVGFRIDGELGDSVKFFVVRVVGINPRIQLSFPPPDMSDMLAGFPPLRTFAEWIRDAGLGLDRHILVSRRLLFTLFS